MIAVSAGEDGAIIVDDQYSPAAQSPSFTKVNAVNIGDSSATYGFPSVDLSAGGTIHTGEHVLCATRNEEAPASPR